MIAARWGSPPPESGEARIDCESTWPQIKATTDGFSSNDGANVKPDLLAMHYCACKPGATCIFCLRWHRKITGIEQRRADAIRQQALYRRIAGGL